MKKNVLKTILLAFFSWRILLYIVLFLGTLFVPFYLRFTAYFHFGKHLPYFIWAWGNFDGYHYMEIAERGYQPFEQPFFPFFPLLIKAGVLLTGLPYIIIGQLIPSICFVLALYVVYKLLVLDRKQNLFNLCLLVILLFPTSFYYVSVYNDAPFFPVFCINLLFRT